MGWQCVVECRLFCDDGTGGEGEICAARIGGLTRHIKAGELNDKAATGDSGGCRFLANIGGGRIDCIATAVGGIAFVRCEEGKSRIVRCRRRRRRRLVQIDCMLEVVWTAGRKEYGAVFVIII